jgi:hypothetical protein
MLGFGLEFRGLRPFLRAGARTRNWTGVLFLILVLWKRRKGKTVLAALHPEDCDLRGWVQG